MFSFPPIFNHDEIAARQAALARLMSERLSALAERVFVQAETAAEALRLQQGGLQQQLAKTTAQLEMQTATAQEMKDRLNKLNQTFLNSGARRPGWHALVVGVLRRVLRVMAAGVS